MSRAIEEGFNYYAGIIYAGWGTLTIVVIQLSEVKDFVAVLVGVITGVCMIYTTFFKKPKNEPRS